MRSIIELDTEHHRQKQDLDGSSIEDHAEQDEETQAHHRPKRHLHLSEYISSKTPFSPTRKRRTKRNPKAPEESKKRKLLVITEEAKTTEDQLTNALFEPFPGPIAIPLPIAELEPTYLRSKYTGMYWEGTTIPRSFIIDISSQLKNRLHSDEYFASASKGFDLEAYISFMHVKEMEDQMDQMIVK